VSGGARVLHLIAGLGIGGAERTLVQLATGLDPRRFVSSVLALDAAEGALAEALRSRGIPVDGLDVRRRGPAAGLAALVGRLRRERPEVLHTWMFHANLPGRIAGSLVGIPAIVSSEHTLGQESQRRYLASRATGRLADAHVCVSQAVASFALERIGLPGRRLIVIPNGIDVDAFRRRRSPEAARTGLGLGADGPVVGTVSQLKQVKRVDVLLDALGRLPGQRLLVVGDGERRRALEARADALGLSRRLRFCGEQADPRAHLEAMDVFALASDFEGLPVAPLEAMAMGLPVVATDVGGTREVVEDGATGTLVPRGDPIRLAEALGRLLRDPCLRARFGARGLERVTRGFGAQAMVRRYEALYAELLARAPRGRRGGRRG
jgi:glycosyltransferase involved in cell wall biosynthesis